MTGVALCRAKSGGMTCAEPKHSVGPHWSEHRHFMWQDGESPELTGTGALAKAGYTHCRRDGDDTYGAHDIIDAVGNVVATLKALEVWDWLANQKRSGKNR